MRRLWMMIAVLVFASHTHALTWEQCRDRPSEWYGTPEAIAVADNVLLYQKEAGGWDKNIDMAQPLSDEDRKGLRETRDDNKRCTIDNGSTYTQLEFLAKVYSQTEIQKYKRAFDRGLKFLLDVQYESGGWAQFPFREENYYCRITFNDGAMIGVMELLRHVSKADRPFDFVEPSARRRAAEAVRRGIQCILKCQIVVDGKKTAWCAQHDEKTLEPASARSYEKISLSGAESVGVVRFLMSLERPSPEVVEAIESAIRWFEDAKIMGLRETRVPDEDLPRGYDKIVVQDPSAGPLWARFYQIGTNRPIYCGRDGVIKYNLCEIEHERRVGYSWHTDHPRRLLERDYPKWKSKHKALAVAGGE